jgi:hypothetical protein
MPSRIFRVGSMHSRGFSTVRRIPSDPPRRVTSPLRCVSMIRIFVRAGVLVWAGVVVAGCEDRKAIAGVDGAASVAKSSGAKLASCDRVAAMSVCSEYGEAQLATSETVLTASCTRLGGTFVSAECPNTAIVGTCRLSTGEVRKLYASGAASYDGARAQKECETAYSGKWSTAR